MSPLAYSLRPLIAAMPAQDVPISLGAVTRLFHQVLSSEPMLLGFVERSYRHQPSPGWGDLLLEKLAKPKPRQRQSLVPCGALAWNELRQLKFDLSYGSSGDALIGPDNSPFRQV